MHFRLPPIEVSNANPFEHDALERQKIVDFVGTVIASTGDHPLVLAIDSPYGTGKSTFVEMLGKVLTGDKFQTVYFNAWKADHVSDPLIAMVAALDEAIPELDTENDALATGIKRVKKAAGILLKRGAAVGVKIATAGVVDLSDDIEEVLADAAGDATSDIIEAFEKETEAAKCFKDELQKAVAALPKMGKKPTLVFFIDELDRCRPDFAMSLLERVKHMFDVPNIAFILSVDKHQLEAVTAAVYGDRINAEEYLRKFIDVEFGLPNPSKEKFISRAITRAGLDTQLTQNSNDRTQIVRFLALFAHVYDLSLRAIERCVVRIKVVLMSAPGSRISNGLHIALLVVLRSADKPMFDKLTSGNIKPDEAMAYFRNKPRGAELLVDLEGDLLQAMLATELYSREELAHYQQTLMTGINAPDTTSAQRGQMNQLLRLTDSFSRDVFARGQLVRIAGTVDLAASIRD
jgi:hypothetical protein